VAVRASDRQIKKVELRHLMYKGNESASAPTSRRPVLTWMSIPPWGFDELTSRTRHSGRQTRACDEFVVRPYWCATHGASESVRARIFQARTRRQGSLVPDGSHGVERARNVAAEERLAPGRNGRARPRGVKRIEPVPGRAGASVEPTAATTQRRRTRRPKPSPRWAA
jgi:hypothetical protein